MNFITDLVLAYPAYIIALIIISVYTYLQSESKAAKKFSLYAMLGSFIVGLVIALNSPLVKPKTNVEPFKPSEVVTHQLDEETASKPFTSRLSKPKESKLSESLTFKKEVQEINK